MHSKINYVLLGLAAAFALIGGISLALAQSISSTSDVRIVAQKLEDGRIEFGLKQDGERIQPRARFFPADAPVARWLKSSPITVDIPAMSPEPEQSMGSGDSSTRDQADSVEYGEYDNGITEDGVIWGHVDAGVNGIRTVVSVTGETSDHLYDEARLIFYCDHNIDTLWVLVDAGWRSSLDHEWRPAGLSSYGQPLAYFGVQGTSDWYSYNLVVANDGYSVQTLNDQFWSTALRHDWLRVSLPQYSGSIVAVFSIEELASTPVHSLMQSCGDTVGDAS